MKTLSISMGLLLIAGSAAAHSGAPHAHTGAGVVDLATAGVAALAAVWLALRALRGASAEEEGEK